MLTPSASTGHLDDDDKSAHWAEEVAVNVRAQLDRCTIDDLEQVPYDGTRYEVLNGILCVTRPAPYAHNLRSQHVGLALLSAAPSGLEVLMTGTQAIALEGGDGPCPDVLVFTPGDYAVAVPVAAVALVVEVTSPGNRSNDTVTKLERYARAGIGHYWIADPDRITVYRLDPGEGAYREVTAGRLVRVTEPFPVEVSLLDQALPG